jgi:hypothetical protein
MSRDPAAVVTQSRYPLLTAALERHVTWTRDFAPAGDLESATEAIRDAHATVAELSAADAPVAA